MERRRGDHCTMCKSKTAGEADETRSSLESLAGKSYLDRNVIADGVGCDRHREGWGGILDRAVEDCGVSLGVRVEDDGNPRDLRCDLLEQLKPFSHHGRVQSTKPGDVATRPRDAPNQAHTDGIEHKYENNRCRAVCCRSAMSAGGVLARIAF